VAELLAVGVWLGLAESEPVAEGEAPTERVALALLDTVLLALPLTVEAPVPEPDTVALWLGVWLGLLDPEEVILGLAPALSVPGADGLLEALRLLLLVGEPEAVPLPEAVPEEEPVALLVPVGELLSELLLLPVSLAVLLLEAELLGLAPTVRELVWLELTVELPLTVEEGVGPAVPVPELLEVPVAVGLPVAAGVELPEREEVLVVEAEAPGDRLEVALLLTVELALSVLEGVGAAVPVPL
jgi:hypothetical protein